MAWVDGKGWNTFTDADRNANIQMMLIYLYGASGWDKRAASAAVGAAWAWGHYQGYPARAKCNCNPYYQWSSSYTYIYSGLWAVYNTDAQATNYPGTGAGQMAWLIQHPQYWDGSQVYSSPTFQQFASGSLTTIHYYTVRDYTNVWVACWGWYRNWDNVSYFRSLARGYAEQIYNNFDRFYNGYFTPTWLYFEMSKRKKGGGKLYL